MKVCNRCGDQAEQSWQLLIETINSRSELKDYAQMFRVCEACRAEVFDRLSTVLTDAPKWAATPPAELSTEGNE